MRTIVAYFVAVCVVSIVAVSDAHSRESRGLLLERAEVRLRAIYDRAEFRPKRFGADWLPDSSGYTVLEPVAGEDEPVTVRYDVATGRRTVLDSPRKGQGRESRNISPDGRRALYSERGNLHVRDLDTGQTTPLTRDADGDSISNGRAVWSPDGTRVAYVQSDSSQVRLRSVLVPGDPTYPQVRDVRYARVGGVIPTLRVGVVDARGEETRWLPIPIPAEGFYLGQVSWAGNSDELLVERLSRFRDEREFLLADVRTGAITRIYHESDPAWVVASYGRNAGLEWIRDGRAFIVLSEKDGWRRAYVYSRDGRELAVLTPGASDIIERGRVDEAGGWFYYYASPENATQKYLYRVRLDADGEPERVTPLSQPGTHDYDFSPDGKWAFHTYSTFDTPPVTTLVQLPDHRVVRTLEDNEELRDKVKPLISQPTEFLQLDIGDGVVMDAWMIKPDGFDPSRKYPVFVYVYGEPHLQTVLDAWGQAQADFHRVIAGLGYLVVSIDNRGTPAPKGAAWRRSVFGSLGPLSTEEQAAGLRELGRTRPYVDRRGIPSSGPMSRTSRPFASATPITWPAPPCT
jgi:dipeptidyl-peptidase 4